MWKTVIPILLACLFGTGCASMPPNLTDAASADFDVPTAGRQTETDLALKLYERGDYPRAGRAFVQSAKPGRGDREARLLTAAALCYLRIGDWNQFLDVVERLVPVAEHLDSPLPAQTEFVLRVYQRQIGNRQVAPTGTELPPEIKQLLEGS